MNHPVGQIVDVNTQRHALFAGGRWPSPAENSRAIVACVRELRREASAGSGRGALGEAP